jgi:hypothetical protein
MLTGSVQYWREQALTPEQQLAHIAEEYAAKVLVAFPDATPEQVAGHVADFAPIAAASHRRRFGCEPCAPIAEAIAEAVFRARA